MADKINFEKIVKKSANSLKETYNWHKKIHRKLRFGFYFILLIVVIFLIFFSTAFYFNDNSFQSILIFISTSILLVDVLFEFYFLSNKPPEKVEAFEEYFWKLEKRTIYIRSASYFLVLIFTLIAVYELRVDFFAFSFFLFYLFYAAIIYLVRAIPKLIKSNLITGFGSASLILSLVGFGFFSLSKNLEISSSWLYISFSALVFCFLLYYLKYYSNLNIIQIISLKTINPKILLHEIKPDWKKLKNKAAAMKILKRLDKNGKYGVRQELAKVLISEQNNGNSQILSWIFAILLFVVTSIGEGLVQDIFNEDIKSYMCKVFGVFCK